MQFAQPFWLPAGLLVLVGLFWLYRRFDHRQREALADFASSHLLAQLTASFSSGRRWLKRGLFVAAVSMVFVALARPQWGYHWEEQKREGIDILFAIDTSKSMLTQDVTPDRLTRAKLAVTDLVRKLEGDRVGLIAFAGDAFLQAPLTMDDDAFQESLDAIDTGIIPRGGTDIASAIQEAQAAFTTETKNKKILILITDGEDLEAKGIAAARDAAKDGLTIYTVGVGSATGGLIPVPGDNGGTTFLKDDSGQYVKSHLDESTLKQIAEVTGGIYEPLGQQGEGLDTIYQKTLALLPKQELASRRQRVYEERFQWPLAAGLVLLIASTLIGTRRRDSRRVARPQKAMKAAAALGVFALAAVSTAAQASPQSAEQAYKQGDFPTAEKQYAQAAEQRPDTAPLQFDVGASAYKSADYDKALPAFQGALKTDQIGIQQQAYYNMGNTQYRLGQKTEKSTPQDTIKAWQGAVQSYDAALNLNPNDADAQFNRNFVQKKLDELQKQQQQKKQDQKKDEKQQDKNQQSNPQQNQDQKDQQNQQDKNQQQSNSPQNQDQKPGQPDANQSGSQQNQNDQAKNQQKQDQQKGQGSQADQQDKKNGSQQPSQGQAQNGKPDQQNQANNGNDQQKQNGQQGQPKDSSQAQQQTAGNQDSQTNGNPTSPLGQNGEKQAGPVGPTVPDKTPAKQQPVAAAEPETAPAGQMTKEEARELLNALKNAEHALPVTADARSSGNHAQDQQPLKDW
jgi:Ca-activated chloride channel family protein